jgi:hypothetical protein
MHLQQTPSSIPREETDRRQVSFAALARPKKISPRREPFVSSRVFSREHREKSWSQSPKTPVIECAMRRSFSSIWSRFAVIAVRGSIVDT